MLHFEKFERDESKGRHYTEARSRIHEHTISGHNLECSQT